MVFFDVQPDQIQQLDSLIRARGYTVVQRDAAVSMHIASVNGTPTSAIVSDSAKRRGGRWALRREYRSTFRDTLRGGERLTAGHWFNARADAATDTSEVSLERGIAEDLHVGLGDVITWDVQGVQLATRVTSLREVKWTRFEPNFFAVFPTAALADAPRQYIVLAKVPGDTNVAVLQRDLAIRIPNVSSLDLGIVTATLGKLVDKVDTAIRFMALFSLAMGIPVLFSAVAATRRDRMHEGVLLKTLGASRAQVAAVLLTEYALLGALGSMTGVLLAGGAAWALVHWVFSGTYTVAAGPAIAIAGVMTALTVLIGALASRDVFRETAMAALRE
jgi:putative ABC transport system permease protein